MSPTTYTVTSTIKRFPGHGGWHFVTVAAKQAAMIRKLFRNQHGGWVSLPVSVTLGETSWRTSIFYSKRDREYLMGIKAAVRKAEALKMNDRVTFTIEIVGV